MTRTIKVGDAIRGGAGVDDLTGGGHFETGDNSKRQAP
jgi:hypothetical protein